MAVIFILTFFISLLSSLVLTRFLIGFFTANNIIALDLHKKNRPKVANSGGIAVVFSLIFGLMTFIGIRTFLLNDTSHLLNLFAGLLSILMVSLVGFFDDLNAINVVKGKKDKIYGLIQRKGLEQWQKPALTFAAVVPLMAVKTGFSIINLPLAGSIDLGVLFPLMVVPLLFIFISNAVNMLGGFNGSEGGMGLVYCTALGLFTWLHGEFIAAAIFFSTAGALIGYLVFNWPPAKILSGDSLTYTLGGIVAAGIIIGNMEKAGLIAMIPFIIEFFFKARSKMKASCLGKLRPDGKLDPPYGKQIYSWTHVIMNIKPMAEKEVTYSLIALNIFFSSLIFILL